MKIFIYINIIFALIANSSFSESLLPDQEQNDNLEEMLKNEDFSSSINHKDSIDKSLVKEDGFIPTQPSDYKKHDNISLYLLDKISGKMYKYHGIVGKKLIIKEYDIFIYSCFKRKRIIDEYAYLVGVWKNQDANKMDLDIDSSGVSKKIFLGWLFSYDKATNYFADEYIDIPKITCDD